VNLIEQTLVFLVSAKRSHKIRPHETTKHNTKKQPPSSRLWLFNRKFATQVSEARATTPKAHVVLRPRTPVEAVV
jgi:hypothetical protein